MLWGNDAVAVYVVTDDDWSDHDVPGIEAMMWPDERHPSGRKNLVRVSYLYVRFDGWVKRERILPR